MENIFTKEFIEVLEKHLNSLGYNLVWSNDKGWLIEDPKLICPTVDNETQVCFVTFIEVIEKMVMHTLPFGSVPRGRMDIESNKI
jgi:hypothetical protein